MAKTPQQMADNWFAAMQAPQTSAKYKQGIQNTTVNPMQAAASQAAQALYVQNTALAVSSGRMANKLNSVPMTLWQNNSMTIGAAALSSGAKKGQPKVNSHFQKWAPIYAQASAAAAAIPRDGSVATALAKVQAAISVMVAAKGT